MQGKTTSETTIRMAGSVKKPSHLRVDCPYCDSKVLAEVLSQESDYHEEPDCYRVLSTVRCPGCAFLMVAGQFAESYGEEWDLTTPAVWWPDVERVLPYETPAPIKRAFREATVCRKAGAHTATLVFCRKSIEALAKDVGAKGRTLHAKLEHLRKKDMLDPSLLLWAEELKLAGNDAAHDDWEASRKDADDAIALVDAAVTHVYGLKKRFEEFQERRSKES